MTLLNDKQILEGVTGDEPIIRGLKNPADWYSSDSPVQAASVDLHIGPIYKPGTREDDPGGEKNPEKELVLGTGHTAIVATREELSLPPEVAGFGLLCKEKKSPP